MKPSGQKLQRWRSVAVFLLLSDVPTCERISMPSVDKRRVKNMLCSYFIYASE